MENKELTITNVIEWFVNKYTNKLPFDACKVTLGDTFVLIEVYINDNCFSKFLYRGTKFNDCILLASNYFNNLMEE